MKFLSVCSGIEAASVAWGPLGWSAVAFSEIEPFPSAVLAHHYPDTPNWGDMTKYKDWPDVSIDLLCGGTPCQSFSVAGLRKGLDDPRGNLMLTFGAIAAKYRPKWLVWENVPGVLSSNGGADFGALLGMLGELGYGFAYRVLDAQYFGVAQRRRRVFVVGCLGDWRSAAAVLFERHSLQGHPAPSRKARQSTAADVAPSLVASGRGVERTGETQGQDPVIAVQAFGGNNTAGPIDVATVVRAHGTFHYEFESETFLAAAFKGGQGAKAGGIGYDEEISPTLSSADSGSNRAPCVISHMPTVVGALCKDTYSGGQTNSPGHQADKELIVTHSLRGEGFDASEDGTGRGKPLVPVLAFDTTQMTSVANRSNPKVGDPCHPLAAQAHVPCIAFPERMSGTQCASTVDLAPSMGALNPSAVAYTTKLHNTQSNQAGKVYEEYTVDLDRNSPPPALLTAMQVRRLTPVECARLQGFPDHYLDITVRGKPAADGPKYKALGNSWAVPNVRWIGRRIDAVAQINAIRKAA